jgi:hypothetical protein
MDREGGAAAIVEAVTGLEQAIGGITQILTLHSQMLAELLTLAREKPQEASELEMLIKALVARLDAQNGTLNRIENGIETFNAILAQGGVTPQKPAS